MMGTQGLAALVRSLTGEQVIIADDSPCTPPLNDAAAVVKWLVAAGWGQERITEVRSSREKTGERWPLPVAPAEYAGMGAAQFASARAAVVALMFPIDGKVRDGSAQLSAADARLLAEVPPHHGSAG